MRAGEPTSRRTGPVRLATTGAAALLVALAWLALAGTARAAVQVGLEQCRNGAIDAQEVCTGSAWANGNLNASQAHYREGDAVPFRSVITGLALGDHVLRIQYDATSGGKHAYDYLTDYDLTETGAAPCSGVSGCSGAPSTKAIPVDPTLADAAPPVTPVGGSISAWGATISTVSYQSLPAGPEGTSNTVTVEVSFTATSSTVVLAWGGHIASQTDWGAGDAAGSISGSPFHMNLTYLDGSLGSRDRSLAAAAIQPTATIATAVSAGSVALGGSVTDTATLSGASGAPAGTVAFVVCGPSASAPTCSAGSGTAVGQPVALAGGQATSPPFTPSAAGSYCFRAEYAPASASPYSPTVHTNLTTECFTAVAEPDVSVVKTAEDPIISAGEGAAFGIVVANIGTGTATGVTVSDALPAGVTWGLSPAVQGCSISNGTLNCALGSIASGDSVTIRVAGATTAAACGTLTNTATIGAGNEAAGKDLNNSSTATLRIDCPDLKVRKEAVASTISAGEDASYTITVTNGGAGTASGVTIADDLPAGVAWSVVPPVQGCDVVNGRLVCAVAPLAPGASASVTVTGTTDAADCGLLANTATAEAGNEPAAAAADNTATATIAVNCAPIQLSKTADAPAVSAGDPIGFTIAVTNPGPGAATGASVTDALPATPGTQWSIDGGANQGQCSISGATLVCDFGLLIEGSSASVHISSPTTEASCSTVDNVAQLTTANLGSAQAADQIAVECSSLALDKVADTAAVAAGQPIGFTMTVRNTGTGLARGAALTDPLPAGAGLAWSVSPAVQGCSIAGGVLDCAFGDIPGGGSRTVHVTSPTTVDSCAAYANTATGTSGSASLQGQAHTTVVCAPKPDAITEPVREVLGQAGTPGPAQPQGGEGGPPAAQGRGRLIVVKTAPRRARAGGRITYVIRVTNRGRARARDVVIRDRMPAGVAITRRPRGVTLRSGELTWRVGDLRAGRSRTVRVTVRIARDTAGRRCNVARASADNAATARDRACTVIRRRAVAGVVRPAVTG
jgi:uncharacterized repeat protein (TIGR01451 family)